MQKLLIFVLMMAGVLTLSACTKKGEESYNGRDGVTVPVTNQAEVTSVNPSAINQASTEAVTSSPMLVDGAYRVDISSSRLAWKGAMIAGKAHTGVVPIKTGEFTITGGALIGGHFEIALNELKSDENIDVLDKHLKSADFFDAEKFPTATLEINSVQPGQAIGTYQVGANLTIKGITQPINFLARLGQEGSGVVALADINIDRTIWNIRYGSGKFFQDLGDKTLSDIITFQVTLRAKK